MKGLYFTRRVLLLFSILATSANANEVLVVAAKKPQVGQILPGAELQMILSTERPCYIIEISDELPYHGGIPKGRATDAVCWAFTGDHEITVGTHRQKTVYDISHFERAEAIKDWRFRIKATDGY